MCKDFPAYLSSEQRILSLLVWLDANYFNVDPVCAPDNLKYRGFL